MRRSGVAKFPNSVQLFRFCHKVLVDQKGTKVHDQEVGAILEFNPSDCSHWKRGEKNVKSVFALARLAAALGVEVALIHDLATGAASLDEAYFEYQEGKATQKLVARLNSIPSDQRDALRAAVYKMVTELHDRALFSTPPLYLPEVLRYFPFINSQAADMLDRLTRILRIKPGQYLIHFKKGELKPQTRTSMAKDVGRIIFEAERARFPELGPLVPDMVSVEVLLFTANLLAPKTLLLEEMTKIDSRRNVVAELASLFWVPKTLISFQLQDLLRAGSASPSKTAPSEATSLPPIKEKIRRSPVSNRGEVDVVTGTERAAGR